MNREDLIRGLNQDLAAEWGTILRYTIQAASATGIQGEHLRDILREEVQDELGHAAFLSDVIVDLGGEPTTEPKQFFQPDTLKGMLELDLEMELQDVESYGRHAQLADQLGLAEIKVKLEEMAADEAGHARDIRRILKGL